MTDHVPFRPFPWSLDRENPLRIVDADGAVIAETTDPAVAQYIVDACWAQHAADKIAAMRAVAPCAPVEATPTQGFATQAAETVTRLRDARAAWEWEHPEEATAERERAVEAEKERAAQKAAEEREALIELAVKRGCPRHRPTLAAAIRPRTNPVTPAMLAVGEAFEWYRERAIGASRAGCLIVLSGGWGIGKTVAVVRAVMRFRGSARFVDAGTIADISDSSWSENVAARDAMLRVGLLAIDECGKENSAHAGRRVTTLIRKRYSEGMMTLVTTNLGRDDFMKRYFVSADGAVDGAMESRLAREQVATLPWWRPLPEGDLRGSK